MGRITMDMRDLMSKRIGLRDFSLPGEIMLKMQSGQNRERMGVLV